MGMVSSRDTIVAGSMSWERNETGSSESDALVRCRTSGSGSPDRPWRNEGPSDMTMSVLSRERFEPSVPSTLSVGGSVGSGLGCSAGAAVGAVVGVEDDWQGCMPPSSLSVKHSSTSPCAASPFACWLRGCCG